MPGDGAGDDDHRAELAEHPGRGQGHPVGEAALDRGQGDPPEDGERLGPQGGGRLLLVGADLLEDRQHLADHIGQGHGGRGHHDAGHREDHLDAPGGQPVAEPAGLAVDEDRASPPPPGRRPGAGRRRRRAASPGEPVAGQDQGHPDAEGGVEGNGDEHHHEGEPQGVEGVGRGHRVPGRAEAVLEGPVEDRSHREDHEKRQVARGRGSAAANAIGSSYRLADVEPAPEQADGRSAPAGPRHQHHRDGGGRRQLVALRTGCRSTTRPPRS